MAHVWQTAAVAALAAGVVLLPLASGASADLRTQVERSSAQRGLPQGPSADIEKGVAFPVPTLPGAQLDYTVTLTNTSDPVIGTEPSTILDPIPANTTYVPGSATGGLAGNPPSFNAGSTQIEWGGPLDPGFSSVTIDFSVTIDAGVPGGTQITNTAFGTVSVLSLQVQRSVTVSEAATCGDGNVDPNEECDDRQHHIIRRLLLVLRDRG